MRNNLTSHLYEQPSFPDHKHLRKGHLAVVAVRAVRERLDEQRHSTHQRRRLETVRAVRIAPEADTLGDVAGFVEVVCGRGSCRSTIRLSIAVWIWPPTSKAAQ
jgi:hypothetical protein